MKIYIFFDGYDNNIHLSKCSGQIALGLQDIGNEVKIIRLKTFDNKDSKNNNLVLSINRAESQNIEWWQSQHIDAVIFYSWLQPKYNPIIKTAKDAGIQVILKLDSDGRLQPPIGKPYEGFLYNISRYIKHSLLDESKRLLQSELADAIVIESPTAAANLAYCFNFWTNNHGEKLINKLNIIGNPVTDDIISSAVNKFKTRNIISIGRWDSYQKNKPALIFAANHFLNKFPEYTFTIIGKGINISEFDLQIRNRVSIYEALPHEKIGEYLATAQVLFMPSKFEGMPISGGEALCSGCSICGTPIESLLYLSQGGLCGTLSSDFSNLALLSALELDVIKWNQTYYDPTDIAYFWRQKLNRKTIAAQILSSLNHTVSEYGV